MRKITKDIHRPCLDCGMKEISKHLISSRCRTTILVNCYPMCVVNCVTQLLFSCAIQQLNVCLSLSLPAIIMSFVIEGNLTSSKSVYPLVPLKPHVYHLCHLINSLYYSSHVKEKFMERIQKHGQRKYSQTCRSS